MQVEFAHIIDMDFKCAFDLVGIIVQCMANADYFVVRYQEPADFELFADESFGAFEAVLVQDINFYHL